MSTVFSEASRLIDAAETQAARRNKAAWRTMAEIRSRQFECVIDRNDKCIAEVDDLADPALCAVYVGNVELIDCLNDETKAFIYKQVLEAIDECKRCAAEDENDRRRDDRLTGGV